jgi:hypothetical protein
MRTVKSGQSRWFIGYKKHTLRLWVPQQVESVLLVPLMSWVAPANRGDALFLEPSLRHCQKQLDFLPDLVVADMAYLHLAMQRRVREELGVGILTRLRADLEVPKALESGVTMRCRQGQKLEWLGLHEAEQLHWFAVRDAQPLCPWCWEQSHCPKEFSFAPSDHEIVFGTVPLSSRTGQRLMQQTRPWIEAAQSYEKNQLGLGAMFLNSLRLTWTLSLLADTITLLRARAFLSRPPAKSPCYELTPRQLNLGLLPEEVSVRQNQQKRPPHEGSKNK